MKPDSAAANPTAPGAAGAHQMPRQRCIRAIETSLDIAAPAEAVWKALTDADELTRWFPLRAKVKPQVGGSIWISWGPPYEGESRIEIWEPNRRLRLVNDVDVSAMKDDLGGTMRGHTGAIRVVQDFELEPAGTGTRLRLVHSGFGPDAAWDDEYDSICRGWKFELNGLRHYLERHAGAARRAIYVRRRLSMSPADAWGRVMSPRGLLKETNLGAPAPGDAYALVTSQGDRLEGRVFTYDPPRDFFATAENVNHAYLRLSIESWAGQVEVNLFMSTYGQSADKVDAIESRWNILLDELFTEGRPPASA